MPTLGPEDSLPLRPRRVLVAGTSGSGKTWLAARLAEALNLPQIEIDALFHGPNWSVRETFEADVLHFSAGPSWVTEWQYQPVRQVLAERAELLVWLDLPRTAVMRQVVFRTVRRRLRREALWNGNVEPSLWTVVTDRDHIVRWAWKTHPRSAARVAALQAQRPDLPIVRLSSRRDVRRWISGPVRLCRQQGAQGGGGDQDRLTMR